MPSVDTKSYSAAMHDDCPNRPFNWGLPAYDSELLWAPYRTACKLMLEAHHHAATMMEINRKLADDFFGIVRREQDLMHESMEKILLRLADGSGPPTGVGTMTSESLAECYESAVSSLRELGEAMSEARSHSIEALQKHAQAVAEATHPEAERKSAA